jgi:nicotinamidase-related amidase
MTIKFLSVDFQHDFSRQSGYWMQRHGPLPRSSVTFLHRKLIPYLKERNERISEIISDYRLPRPSEQLEYCVPGTPGFESEIPFDLVRGRRWIKSMNFPSWTRAHAGDRTKIAGIPYCAPTEFGEWLIESIGRPENNSGVILIGLTLDCCVLSVAQELKHRGYKAFYLFDAVDTYRGTLREKNSLFRTPLPLWGTKIEWKEFQKTVGVGHPANQLVRLKGAGQ